MNTPRTKAPRRLSGNIVQRHKPKPDGAYSAGLWSQRHLAIVGQIATYWTTVEDEMIEVLRDLLGGGSTLPARQIFRSITSNEARRKLMTALLERAPINHNKDTFYDDTLAEFYRLNGRRNEYIHGYWQTYQDGASAYLSIESLDDYHFFEAREVPIEELDAVFREMSALMRRLLDHRIAGLRENLKTSPESTLPPLDEENT